MFKPFDIKFSSEKLNQQVTFQSLKEALKNKKIACTEHDKLDFLVSKPDGIYCTNCQSKVRIVPAWTVPI